MSVFSIPPYPGAVSYNLQYSDPTLSDPYGQNPLGPWVNMSSVTTTSNIVDAAGDPDLRLYRVQPVVSINGANVNLIWYDPFSVSQSSPGAYNQWLYDASITWLLPSYREFIGDYGTQQTSSTDINLDTGAGSGLLVFDGSRKIFNLADIPDANPALVIEGTVSVVQNGLTKRRGIDYWVNYEAGQVVFATAPLVTDTCSIKFAQGQYSNRQLCASLKQAIDGLSQLLINGYGTNRDNNVYTNNGGIPEDGLRIIIFQFAMKILARAVLRVKSETARAYKVADFSMDTAPSRIIDGMSNQMERDWTDLKAAANNYIRTATRPITHTTYDSFFDFTNTYPGFSLIFMGLTPSYSWYI